MPEIQDKDENIFSSGVVTLSASAYTEIIELLVPSTAEYIVLDRAKIQGTGLTHFKLERQAHPSAEFVTVIEDAEFAELENTDLVKEVIGDPLTAVICQIRLRATGYKNRFSAQGDGASVKVIVAGCFNGRQ
jgi:hypothetical protein